MSEPSFIPESTEIVSSIQHAKTPDYLTLRLTVQSDSGLSLTRELRWDPLGRDYSIAEDILDELTNSMLVARNALQKDSAGAHR